MIALVSRQFRSLLLVSLALPLGSNASAQFVERPPHYVRVARGLGVVGSQDSVPKPEVLQQTSLDFSSSSPTARFKVMKYYAKFGQSWVPLFLYLSTPAVSPESADTSKVLASQILSPYGGAANMFLSKPFGITRHAIEGHEGLFLVPQIGGKLLDNFSSPVSFTGAGYAELNLDAYLPVFATPNTDLQQGLISLHGSLAVHYVNSKVYERRFATITDGPSHLPAAALVAGSIHIFEQLYVSIGYSWCTNVETLDHRTFATVSFSRPNQ